LFQSLTIDIFLDNVAGWILELDHGHAYPYEGNYSGWLEQKQARLAHEESQSSARQRTLAQELEWVKLAPKARQAKSKARLTAYDQLVAEHESVEKQSGALELTIPMSQRLGDQVIEVKGVSKGFGDDLLIEDLSFILPPAGIVGVIGANGAGKTTLFRMITGQDTPDSGEILTGATVQLAYVDQSRDSLEDGRTVYEEITDGLDIVKVGNRELNGRSYVASFNFKGADQQ